MAIKLKVVYERTCALTKLFHPFVRLSLFPLRPLLSFSPEPHRRIHPTVVDSIQILKFKLLLNVVQITLAQRTFQIANNTSHYNVRP